MSVKDMQNFHYQGVAFSDKYPTILMALKEVAE